MAIDHRLDPALAAAACQCLVAHNHSVEGGIETVLSNIALHSAGVLWAPAQSSLAQSVLLHHSAGVL